MARAIGIYPSVVNLKFPDVVGGDEDANSNGDENNPDDEEGRQDSPGGEDGLPSRKPLLLEGRVIWLLTLGGHPRAHTRVMVAVLLLVVHRHGGVCTP